MVRYFYRTIVYFETFSYRFKKNLWRDVTFGPDFRIYSVSIYENGQSDILVYGVARETSQKRDGIPQE